MKRFTYFLLAVFLAAAVLFPSLSNAQAKVDIEKLKKDLPHMFGSSNVGKDFWFTVPPCFFDESFGSENFIRLFITSPSNALCVVEIPGKGFYSTQQTIANDVIQFPLTPNDAQPYVKKGNEPYYPEKVYTGAGVHVFSEAPLVVYVAVRYHYTSDSWLCVPTASFGKEYIVASYGDMTAMFPSYTLPSLSGCVAAYDDTKVRFTLGGNPKSVTAGGLLPLQSANVNLNKGDVWMISSKGPDADLTGSKFAANKPIGVVSGNQCTNIPTDNQWCDYTAEMDLPTYVWGLDYYVPVMPGRKYPPLMRIFGKDPGTSFYRDGNMIGTVTAVPGLMGKGWFEQRLHPMGIKPHSVTVSGTAPIGVVEYNTGVQEDGYPLPNSDPFECVISPIQQYQKEITFCTPGLRGNFGFPENNLNVVYETNQYGYMPDDMMFAKVESGAFQWQQFNQKYPGIDEKFTKLQQPGDRQYALKLVRLPGDGVYKVKANKPFAAYAFGFGWCDSYGHPTSFALIDQEHPDTNAPDPRWTPRCTGNVDNGTVTDMPDDDSVRSNLARIDFLIDSSFNYDFQYKDFIPGQTRTTTWQLNVIDPLSEARAFIRFSDRRGNDTVIVINYYPPKVQITPDMYDFGHFKLGESKTMDFLATNLSDKGPLVVTRLPLAHGDQNFIITNITPALPAIIPPLGQLTFKVRFTAVKEGTFQDSIAITDDSCYFFQQSFVQASVGVPVIIVGNTAGLQYDADFGNLAVNATNTLPIPVRNTGNAPLTVTGHSNLPGGSAYKIIWGADGEPTAATPWVIMPNTQKGFMVSFTPPATMNYKDQITFYSDAQTIDSIAPLNGNGIQAGLNANNYNWKNRHIDRASDPRPAYGIDAGDPPAIVLEATGNKDVVITDIVGFTNPSINKSGFEFPNGDIYVDGSGNFQLSKTIKIPKGETFTIPVKFHPTAVGPYEVRFHYKSDAISDPESFLKGVGILGELTTNDLDFSTTVLGDNPADPTKIQTRTVKFTNDNKAAFPDSIIINSFTISNGNDIDNKPTWGAKGFRYDNLTILKPNGTTGQLPVTLQPGQSITVTGDFFAKVVGPAQATLTTDAVTAKTNVTSVWNGIGLNRGIQVTGDQTTICANDTKILKVTIKNSSVTTLLQHLKVKITPKNAGTNDDKYFTFLTAADATPADLLPNTNETISIKFDPANTISPLIGYAVTITVTSDDDPNIMGVTTLTGISQNFTRSTTSQFISTTTNARITSLPITSDLSKPQANFVLDMQAKDNANLAQVKQVEIILSYPTEFMVLDLNKFTLGAALNGFALNTNLTKVSIVNGLKTHDFIFDQKNPAIFFGNGGNLFTIGVSAYLQNYSSLDAASKGFTDTVKCTINIPNNACLTVAPTNDNLTLEPICAHPYREVVISANSYYMNEINPNPVSSNGTNINFGLGLSGFTEVKIYNSNGELVATPVSKEMKAGEYSIPVPVESLSSGVYSIHLNSYPFNETKKLVIVK
ncbi:MAG: choice-of-anchor D domain-containing protein [Candidatus Kapabacteria bacterium]|nr:choice-of-anchor D domain-containing protein [Candidatus Kapabacteria bacterium]